MIPTGQALLQEKVRRAWRQAFIAVFFLVALVAAQTPDRSLRTGFVDQLFQLESLHIEANAVIHLTQDGVTRAGNGTFSYWEQSEWFRIRCHTSRALKLLGDIEWSFDGRDSRIWLKAENMITDDTSKGRIAPTAIPNPFFLPVKFLLGEQVCTGCRFGIDAAIRAAAQMAERRLGPARVSVENKLFDRDYQVQLRKVEGVEVPSRISWLDEVADVDGEILVSDYERVGPLLWPTSITMKVAGRSSDMSMRMQYFITVLEVNESYPREVFTLQGDEGTVFYESPE